MDDDPPNSQPQVPVELGPTVAVLGIWKGRQHIYWEIAAKGIMKMDITSNLTLEEMHILLLLVD